MPQCKKCGSELPEGATYCPKCGAAVEAAKVLDLANWGERFVAWLIDVIIIGVAIWVIRGFVWVAWPGYTCGFLGFRVGFRLSILGLAILFISSTGP